MSGTDGVFTRGDLVLAVDASGEELPKRALGPAMRGTKFTVVWVCREEEWQAAQREGREPDGVPWPVEDVRARTPASD